MADARADRPFTQPHPERLSAADPSYDKVVQTHTAALERGDMSYPDPASGLSVLTAAYLAARGTCCDSGCRHCPYLD